MNETKKNVDLTTDDDNPSNDAFLIQMAMMDKAIELRNKREQENIVAAHRIIEKEREDKRKEERIKLLAQDYSKIMIDEQLHSFGFEQAKIIKALCEAYNTEYPWVRGVDLTGSYNRKVPNIFSKHPTWKQLVESDKGGNYRLKLPGDS